MKQKEWVSIKVARCISRSLLKISLNPVIYFLLLLICYIHTLICITPQQSSLYVIIKWFDPSIYIGNRTLVCILVGPCLLSAFAIILQLGWALKQQSIQTSITKHYIIKISVTMAFVMSYSLCLPLIRCCISLIMQSQIGYQIVAIITLICYLFINYLYTMFLMTDLSPQNNVIFAYLDMPNCFTILNVYRPIAALILATNNSSFQVIPMVIMFIITNVLIFKYPIITWNYNQASQMFISAFLWAMLCRMMTLISRQQIIIIAFFIGIPTYMLFMNWILRKRMISIIKKQKNTVLKLKTIYFILFNSQKYDQQLDIFIVTHYKCCVAHNCCCHKIFEQFYQQKLANQNLQLSQKQSQQKTKTLRRSESKFFPKYPQSKSIVRQNDSAEVQLSYIQNQNQQLKQKQKIYWFQLLKEMQSEQFMIDKIRQLPVTEKDIRLKKARQIIMDQAQILHYYLDKQYQSLRNLWFIAEQIKQSSMVSFFFLVRFCIEQYRQQQTIKQKSKQEGSNQYALNFYQLQTKLLHFRQLLLKSAIKTEHFWHEMSTKQPDQKKIIKSIQEVLKTRQSISAYLQKFDKKINKNKNSSSEYEQNWQYKIKKIIENVYLPFQIAMQMVPALFNDSGTLIISNPKQSKQLEKNLIFYDCQAKTGMGIVNIQEGEEFGLIKVTNKQFWELFGYSRFDKPRINHFLVKQMHKYHDRTIVNFLQKNKHFLSFHAGFVVNGSKLLVQIQFSVQILPHVYEGLFASAFLQQVKSQKCVFLTDKASNIISYNKKFKQIFLETNNLQQFDEIINKQVIMKIETQKKCVITIDNQDYLVENYHSICNEDDAQNLYFCQIHQQWDNIPIKTVAVQQEQKQDFYTRNDDKKLSKIQALVPEKKKQKKEDIQYLMYFIKSQKKSSKLFKWNIFLMVSLVVIFLLVALCSGLTQMKVHNYKSANNSYQSLTNLIQDFTKSVNLARKLNILSHSNQTQSIDSIIAELNQYKISIIDQKTELNLGLWPQSFNSFEISQNNQFTSSLTTFEMITQKNVLSAYTTLLSNVQEHSFDYVKSEVTLPYTSSFSNFLGLIYNTFYIVLPKTNLEFRKFMTEAWSVKINLPFPITPISILISTFALVIQIVTIIFRVKIHNSLWETLKLLQKLKMAFIQQRVRFIRAYCKSHLSDLTEYEKFEQKNKVRIQSTNENKNEQATDAQLQRSLKKEVNKNLSVQNLNSTFRDLVTPRQKQPVNPNKKQKQKQKKDRNLLKIQKLQKSKIIVFVILGVLPLVIFGFTIAAVQAYYSKTIWNLLCFKELFCKKTQQIDFIRAYSYELGLQTPNFKSQAFSISTQMSSIIQKTYLVQRELQNSINIQRNTLVSFIKQLNQKQFCAIVKHISQKQGTSNTCTPQLMSKYKQKSRSEVLVEYIETARSIYNQYGTGNLSVAQQRQFVGDSRHLLIQQLNKYLSRIENYLIDKFDEYFSEEIRQYQITLISMCMVMIPFLIFIKVWWSSFQIRQMQNEMLKIKIILQLISQIEINSNLELKKEIIQKQEVFNILI